MMIDAWQAGAGILASSVIVGGGAVAVVRHMLKAAFVTRAQHETLERAVSGLRERLGALPNEHDVSDLTRRMGGVEKGVAVVQETARGMEAGLKRVEHTMGMLLQRMLEKDK